MISVTQHPMAFVESSRLPAVFQFEQKASFTLVAEPNDQQRATATLILWTSRTNLFTPAVRSPWVPDSQASGSSESVE